MSKKFTIVLLAVLVILSRASWGFAAEWPEHFEGPFPPQDWAIYQLGDASSGWFQGNPGYESDHSAIHIWEDYDCDNWLVTPAVSIPDGKSDPIIHFRHMGFSCSKYVYHGVWVSTGSGDPNDGQFVQLDSIPAGPEGDWTEYWTNLSAYSGQSVYLAFVYQGRNADAWLIDEVFVGDPPDMYLYDEELNPICGGLDETYTYSVTYQHNNNVTPTIQNAYIDDVPHAMTDPTGGSGPYSGGVVFTYGHRFALGGAHFYYFEFSDGADTSRCPPGGSYYGPRNGYYHWDFEDAAHFTATGPADDWQWGIPTSGPGGAHSGEKGWGTVLDGDHSNNSQSRLQTPTLDFTIGGGSKLELRFMSWVETDSSSPCDGGNIKIITPTDTTILYPDTTQCENYNAGCMDAGNAWIPGEPAFYGQRMGEETVIDLTPWTGESNAIIVFDFGSDGSVTDAGWYFDDVIIWGDPPLPVELTSLMAAAGDGMVTLNWETESERNNQGFEIYRRVEGEDFVRINAERVPGAGNTAAVHTYTYVDRDLINGVAYYYKLADVDFDGNVYMHDVVVSAIPTSILPKTFALSQNYPNPFNPITHIRYQLAKDVPVSLRIYNVMGQQVIALVDGVQKAGYYQVEWRGTDQHGRELASGVYFYRLDAGERVFTRKMVLLK
jgi:hypothetical protein